MRRARKVKATIPSAGETLDVTWRIPLLKQEGWTRHQTLERRGRGGQSGMTTPSALSKVATQLFLDAQLPLLSQEGNTLSCSGHPDGMPRLLTAKLFSQGLRRPVLDSPYPDGSERP